MDEFEWFEDPEARELPEPYRSIDDLLWSIFDRAWEKVKANNQSLKVPHWKLGATDATSGAVAQYASNDGTIFTSCMAGYIINLSWINDDLQASHFYKGRDAFLTQIWVCTASDGGKVMYNLDSRGFFEGVKIESTSVKKLFGGNTLLRADQLVDENGNRSSDETNTETDIESKPVNAFFCSKSGGMVALCSQEDVFLYQLEQNIQNQNLQNQNIHNDEHRPKFLKEFKYSCLKPSKEDSNITHKRIFSISKNLLLSGSNSKQREKVPKVVFHETDFKEENSLSVSIVWLRSNMWVTLKPGNNTELIRNSTTLISGLYFRTPLLSLL
eukprot:m.199378 g.199378  ORF g.199378 m.199378 type:complete len:327 (+) comp15726_c1_seq8:247-1227(+)